MGIVKKIEIITRPFYLDEIKDLLSSMGIEEIIASDIRISNSLSSSDTYLQEDYFVEFMPKIRIEFFTEKKNLDEIVKALKQIADKDGERDTSMYVHEVQSLID